MDPIQNSPRPILCQYHLKFHYLHFLFLPFHQSLLGSLIPPLIYCASCSFLLVYSWVGWWFWWGRNKCFRIHSQNLRLIIVYFQLFPLPPFREDPLLPNFPDPTPIFPIFFPNCDERSGEERSDKWKVCWLWLDGGTMLLLSLRSICRSIRFSPSPSVPPPPHPSPHPLAMTVVVSVP